jgi:NADPH2 dehydrogenase
MRNVRAIKEPVDFLAYAQALGLRLPFCETVHDGPASPLAAPLQLDGLRIGNRLAILPMEGWDNTTDGRPTDHTRHRWERWGASGAKLIFGAEAMAVRPDGRGSPNQLLMLERNVGEIAALREHLVSAHRERFGTTDGLVLGCQLTHSGRVSHPHDMSRSEPRILYHHPLLDEGYNAQDAAVLSDDEIDELIADFIEAGRLSQAAGFDFVDIKHCHGYLGHEFLSAVDRPGKYGGPFANRTRFLRDVVAGIRKAAPGLEIAVRFSAVDFVPFVEGTDGRAGPATFPGDRYPYAFGGDGSGVGTDLEEPLAFLDLLTDLGIRLVGVSAGAEYNSHLMEPYASLPVEPHKPPEDPLVGVARLIDLTAVLKRRRPDLVYVGAGYSALQQWFPNVAEAAISEGLTDFVGIGRMSYAYPDICADILEGRPLQRRRCCRSCGYCDVAPAFGFRSGCYALDDFYHRSEDYKLLLAAIKES